MNVKISIHHNYLIEKKIDSIRDWKVPESTKKEIREFIDKARIGQVNEGKRLNEATISKYLSLLKNSLEIINKPTSKITKKDIENYDREISKLNLKSVADYKVDLQVFLKWKLGTIKAEEIAGWLDTRRKSKTPDYLKEAEIEKLFKSCENASGRFLIAVLFDTGARIEELLNIRYEDIELPNKNQNFVKITFKEEYSKTNGRVISCYWEKSLEAIKDFLKEREQQGIKSNEEVFNKNYGATRMFLLRLGKRVLKKEINPHLFRHSSATYYADKLNRQQLCYRYGWAFSSDMPDVYISRAGMNNREIDEKFEATELSELKKELSKEKMEREKIQEQLVKDRAYTLTALNLFLKNKKIPTEKEVMEIVDSGKFLGYKR